MSENYTDKEIVALIRSGSLHNRERATMHIISKYLTNISNYLAPRIPPTIEVKDIFFFVLATLILKIEVNKLKVNQEGDIEAMLFDFCKKFNWNECRSYNRYQVLKKNAPVSSSLKHRDPLVQVIVNERNALLALFILKLEYIQRQVVTLRYYYDYSHQEIAQELDLSSKENSANILSRTKVKLKEMIEKDPVAKSLLRTYLDD